MNYWCEKQQLQLAKTIDEYLETRKKYSDDFNENGMIDGLSKLTNTSGIDEIRINALYYLDFYTIERYGKTHLGTLMTMRNKGRINY